MVTDCPVISKNTNDNNQGLNNLKDPLDFINLNKEHHFFIDGNEKVIGILKNRKSENFLDRWIYLFIIKSLFI